MNLKKEEVYIDLRGMSKEELTELYWLLKNNNEGMYRDKLDMFLDYPHRYKLLIFRNIVWAGYDDCVIPNKTKVTLNELKNILEPMENKELQELISYAESINFDKEKLSNYINFVISHPLYCELEGSDTDLKDKVKLFIDKYKPKDTLQEQLEKAKAEIERLKELINEPQAGDWALLWDDGEETPLYGKITHYNGYYHTCNGVWDYGRKVTNKQLIELLENESKL